MDHLISVLNHSTQVPVWISLVCFVIVFWIGVAMGRMGR